MNHCNPNAASYSKNATAVVADAVADYPTASHLELAEVKDRYLRLSAEFENFRKRTRRDSEQAAAAEKELFIRGLLPVLDNIDRALAAGQSNSYNPEQRGLEITLQQLIRLLNDHGIEVIEDEGQLFDPHWHEALSLRHDPSQPDNVILEVVQRGYSHGDKVFRPAQVIVNDLGDSPGVSHAS
ncbi:MAG: nucleotide exchange factor GrpE [Candidatus Zixiibacteriota bacterium]